MENLITFVVWTGGVVLPLFYLSLLFKRQMPSGFKDNLTLLNACILLPLAGIAGKILGHERINSIPLLSLLAQIINIFDFTIVIVFFVASWKFDRPGLAVACIFLFVLAINPDLYVNNLATVLMALLCFSIGFSEKLREAGLKMM